VELLGDRDEVAKLTQLGRRIDAPILTAGARAVDRGSRDTRDDDRGLASATRWTVELIRQGHRHATRFAGARSDRQLLARLGQPALERDRVDREWTTRVRLESEHERAVLLVHRPEQHRTQPELRDAAAISLAAGDHESDFVAHGGLGMRDRVKYRVMST
jgi:hypothetical protein